MTVRARILCSLACVFVIACSHARDERLDGECISDGECDDGRQCVAGRCAAPGTRLSVSGEVRGATARVDVRAGANSHCGDQRCSVPPGASATLATPELPGFRFRGWSGHPGCTGLAHQLQLGDLREDVACTADYVARVAVVGESEGAEASIAVASDSGDALCVGARCEVDVGQTVTLLAPSVPGFRLRGWTGEGCAEAGGALAIARDVVAARTCTAHYVAGVSVSGSVVNADGEVIASSDSAGAQCRNGSCAIDAGGAVVLRAPALAARTFEGWSGDPGCSGRAPELVLRDVTSSKACRATFAPRLRISGKVAPEGAGRIAATASGATVRCGEGACEVDVGTPVALSASASERYRFTGWSGGSGCMGSAPRLEVRAPRSSLGCTANFAHRPYAVTLIARGGGRAEASVAGVPCVDNACNVAPGGSVSLRAETSGEELFQGFACSPSPPTPSGPLTATLADIRADHTCVANVVKRAVVNFDRGTSGCGRVRASVAPASGASPCGANSCRVRVGATLTLQAEPGQGCSFERWVCRGGSKPTIRGSTLTVTGVADVPALDCRAEFSVIVI